MAAAWMRAIELGVREMETPNWDPLQRMEEFLGAPSEEAKALEAKDDVGGGGDGEFLDAATMRLMAEVIAHEVHLTQSRVDKAKSQKKSSPALVMVNP